MEAKDILTIVFSSTLITTLITSIFNLLTSKKKDAIENITKERKEWRDQLRIVSKAIAESKNIAQLYSAISDLKVRINAYGIAKSSIFCDAHFWQQISCIEAKTSLSENEFQNTKTVFVNQISCLLKYDWERSKAEIRGNAQTKIVVISLIISFLLYSIRWFYYYSIGVGKIDNYISYCVLYMLLVAFSVLVIYAANKWRTSVQFYGYISISLLGGILLYFFVYSVIPSARPFDVIDFIIHVSPYLTLLYCAEVKLLAYRNNIKHFVLASAISAGRNIINEEYKIFFGKAELINICTNEEITFGDGTDLNNTNSNSA